MKSIITDKAPQPIGPYAQAVVAGNLVFCSGQVGINPQTNRLAETIEQQTEQILKNLDAILQAAGADLSHVVKTTIYLTDITDFPKVNEVYGKYFGNTKPARATVEVAKLPQGKLPTSPLIEIEAIASLR